MTENDQKIRKQWLMLWALTLALAVVTIFLQFRFDPSFHPFPMAVRYGIAAFGLLGSVGLSFLIYHCGYRKPGTKMLTFCLIVTGISLVATPILYLSGKIQAPSYIPYYGAYLLLTQGMGVYWAILCWKMRKINQRLQVLSQAS